MRNTESSHSSGWFRVLSDELLLLTDDTMSFSIDIEKELLLQSSGSLLSDLDDSLAFILFTSF